MDVDHRQLRENDPDAKKAAAAHRTAPTLDEGLEDDADALAVAATAGDGKTSKGGYKFTWRGGGTTRDEQAKKGRQLGKKGRSATSGTTDTTPEYSVPHPERQIHPRAGTPAAGPPAALVAAPASTFHV